MLGTARGTQAVIDLEQRGPDVLFETVGGSDVFLWPQIRTQVWTALNQTDYGGTPLSSPLPASRVRAASRLARSLTPSRWDAVVSARRSPLAFVVGGTTVSSVNGAERNWLVGDYADHHGGAIVQWRPLPGRWGRPAHPRSWSMAPALVRAQTRARLARREPEPRIEGLVREIIGKLDVTLDNGQVERVVASAVARERLRPAVERAFERVLDRLQPTVVVMEEAAYGDRATLVTMMKDRGVHVAEPQHGWIGPTHAAYNFGAAMAQEPLRRTLPDELLTFGDYWAEGLRFPGKITPIGKPHLEAAVAAEAVPVEDRSEILVVSSTSNPEEMSEFVLALRGTLDARFTVVFRPHPSERPTLAKRYPKLVESDTVVMDERADVYEALGAAAAVIGVASTVLFEARAFGCRVFVRKSPMTEYYVGDLFGPVVAGEEGLRQMAEAINAGHFAQGPVAVAREHMWATKPEERFAEWLAGVSGHAQRT